MAARIRVSLAGDARGAMDTIVKNYEKYFASVLCEKQPTPELEAMPSYLPDTVVLQFYRDDGEAEFADYMDANSLTFARLGDAGRPALCGIDATAQPHHEGAQRTVVSAAGIVSSIRRRLLCIPFGISEFSQLLRRAYNTEKATATIVSMVLPRRLYWLTPFRMPCVRRNRSIVSPRLVVLVIFLARPELDPPQGILPLTSGVLIRTSWSCGMNS
ncbi:mitotic centromere-associated kinesin (MCAK) [Trypanosoma cruzi]|nr:mitotic centromere-associated kinesin (MCAK) [Trypanosoma cruzi]